MARTKQAARKSTGGKAPATADYESCQEKHSLYQLGEKSSPLQARNHRASRNPLLPEIDRTSDPEAAFLVREIAQDFKTGPRFQGATRSGLQETSERSAPGGSI